jgi:hypothetical protein
MIKSSRVIQLSPKLNLDKVKFYNSMSKELLSIHNTNYFNSEGIYFSRKMRFSNRGTGKYDFLFSSQYKGKILVDEQIAILSVSFIRLLISHIILLSLFISFLLLKGFGITMIHLTFLTLGITIVYLVFKISAMNKLEILLNEVIKRSSVIKRDQQ